jgi:6-pyruvoyltetrahydropterin/6-carboxytetrahydropterin synthase
MFELRVEAEFSSSHQLRGYEGRCENLHGHNWQVEMHVKGESLNNIGLLIDFKELRKILNSIIKPLDHVFINDIKPFDKINPSAENIAKYIFLKAKEELKEKNVNINKICVYETPKSMAIYYDE